MKFLILIGVVIIFTIVFCVLLWRQAGRFQKRAIEARNKQEEQKKILKKQLMEEKLVERKRQRAEAEARAQAEAKVAVDLISQAERKDQ